MKALSVFAILTCLAASATAQTRGVIECRGESGVSAWESPGSLVALKYFSCGDNVSVLGTTRGYMKIQLSKTLTAFVKAEYVRVEESRIDSPSLNAQLEKHEREQQSAVAPAPAPEIPKQAKGSFRIKRTGRSGLELGFELMPLKYQQYQKYAELVQYELMEESGIIQSIYGSYTFRPRKLMLRPEGRFSFGTVDYTNPDYGGSREQILDIRDYIVEARCLFGRDFTISEKIFLTPFSGLGYRYLYDGMGGKTNRYRDYFYDRKSHFLYNPIGLEGMFGLGSGWVLGVSGEYDYFWRGWLFSEYGDFNPELQTLMNVQKNGWGARGSVKIIKRLGRTDLVIEPFLRYWSIGKSEMAGLEFSGYQEPANKSTEWGARLGVRF